MTSTAASGSFEPPGRAEDAVEHLGLHAVAVLVLDAQIGIGEAADALLAVVVEPGLGHAVGAMDACPGTYWRPRRAHAVHARPRLAPFFVVHIGPFGPSAT